MVLFIILAIVLILLVAFTVLVAAIGGTVGIILFSDVIVCILFIAWIMKKILKK